MKKGLARTLVLVTLLPILVLAVPAYAQEEGGGGNAFAIGMNALGAGLAMGLSALGAGYAIARAGAAASSATAEKPELFGRLLIYLVLGEGLAIYGLLIAILVLVLNKP